ncbi:hypothetical protein FACS1894190_10700 [Spirochaetia bacterium]|nr:hypothetical protein FACS1894190_10700 [Spirochaetia bacterium]
MKTNIERKKTDYIVVCVDEFSHACGLTTLQAYRYLAIHGGIDFLVEHYDAEHTLSFADVIDDLKAISRRAGGKIQ